MARLLTLSSFALSASMSAPVFGSFLVTENFNNNTDTYWDKKDNRTPDNNYGWSNTDNTGSTVNPVGGTATGAGELGGLIDRTTIPSNFYGFDIGTITLSEQFQANGTIRVVVPGPGNGGLFLGYFRGASSFGTDGDPSNFTGFFLNDAITPFALIASSAGGEIGRDRSPTVGINIPVGVTVPIGMDFDPTVGPNGRLRLTVNGVNFDHPTFFNANDLDPFTHFGILGVSFNGGTSEVYLDDFTFSSENEIPAGLPGDFNLDTVVDAQDIDLLCDAIEAGGTPGIFDVNNDGTLDDDDLTFQVEEILNTKFGDTDTDGDVDLADLGNLATGFGQTGEKRWARGNFDCDTDVDLNDLGTLATNFQAGRAAAFAQFEALVPEPGSVAALGLAAAALGARCRRRV